MLVNKSDDLNGNRNIIAELIDGIEIADAGSATALANLTVTDVKFTSDATSVVYNTGKVLKEGSATLLVNTVTLTDNQGAPATSDKEPIAIELLELISSKINYVLSLTTEGIDTQLPRIDIKIEGSHIEVNVPEDWDFNKVNQTPNPTWDGDANKRYAGIKVKAPIKGVLKGIYRNRVYVADTKGLVKLYVPLAEKNDEGNFEKLQ